jgi:DNA-binding response OmpR family regulator
MKKTLFVDDMIEVYDQIKDTTNIDYSPNLKDALKRIRDKKYTKIITDYHLGDKHPKGGIKILREASKRGIECILTSTENHKEEALKWGVKFIFKKDFLSENGRE